MIVATYQVEDFPPLLKSVCTFFLRIFQLILVRRRAKRVARSEAPILGGVNKQGESDEGTDACNSVSSLESGIMGTGRFVGISITQQNVFGGHHTLARYNVEH